jgi:tRNA nucleotidyltransferase (CCA-adding enzyme)
MKGRKAQQMHAPVRGYMNRDLVTAAPDTTVTDIEGLIFRHNIGHLPILDGNRLAGIVTRTDLLKFMQDRYKENRRALRRVQAG